MGWTNQQTDSLTLPPGSTGAPRIFLGAGDPFATAAGALAALMFYWQTDEAFMLWVDAAGPLGFLQFANTDATGIVAVYITMTYDEITGDAVLTLGNPLTGTVNIDVSDFTIDAVSQGRNNQQVGSTTGTVAATVAETVLLTVASATYKAGRAYAVRVGGRIQASVANTTTLRLRFGTTTAGTLVATFGGVAANVATLAAAPYVSAERILIRDSGDPDLTTAFVVTGQTNAGTGTLIGAANEPAYVQIIDVGSWSDFPQGIFL